MLWRVLMRQSIDVLLHNLLRGEHPAANLTR